MRCRPGIDISRLCTINFDMAVGNLLLLKSSIRDKIRSPMDSRDSEATFGFKYAAAGVL